MDGGAWWASVYGVTRAAQLASIRLMSGQVSRGSAREYQADERAGVVAQLASIRLMSRQVSRGSAGDY